MGIPSFATLRRFSGGSFGVRGSALVKLLFSDSGLPNLLGLVDFLGADKFPRFGLCELFPRPGLLLFFAVIR